MFDPTSTSEEAATSTCLSSFNLGIHHGPTSGQHAMLWASDRHRFQVSQGRQLWARWASDMTAQTGVFGTCVFEIRPFLAWFTTKPPLFLSHICRSSDERLDMLGSRRPCSSHFPRRRRGSGAFPWPHVRTLAADWEHCRDPAECQNSGQLACTPN